MCVNIREISDALTIGLLDLGNFAVKKAIQSKRELEKAGTRYLLEELLKTNDFELCYTPENKPLLKGRKEHISISHSHDKLAISINKNENTGIDVELIRERVLNIRHKFLSENELAFAGENVEMLITLWSAKEALYKLHGLKQLDFIENLMIENIEGNVFYGNIETGNEKQRHRLFREKIDNYVLVYTL